MRAINRSRSDLHEIEIRLNTLAAEPALLYQKAFMRLGIGSGALAGATGAASFSRHGSSRAYRFYRAEPKTSGSLVECRRRLASHVSRSRVSYTITRPSRIKGGPSPVTRLFSRVLLA